MNVRRPMNALEYFFANRKTPILPAHRTVSMVRDDQAMGRDSISLLQKIDPRRPDVIAVIALFAVS